MNIEVKSITIDSKAQTVQISGVDLDKVLLSFDFDSEPEEVDFKFDWSDGPGPRNYLLKVIEKQRKDPKMSFKEVLDNLPGKIIFLNNNFIVK